MLTAPSRFSQNTEQTWNLLVIIINQPDSAVLYSWVIINDDFSKLCCTLRCYSCNQTSDRWVTPITIIVHAHGAGTIQGQGLFHSAQAWWQVWNNSTAGRIHTQGNTVLKTPTLVVDNQLPQCRLFVSLVCVTNEYPVWCQLVCICFLYLCKLCVVYGVYVHCSHSLLGENTATCMYMHVHV